MEAPKQAFPLTWPAGRQRTAPNRRKEGKFKVAFGQARDELLAELARLGARGVILSSDAPLRRDGLPYADADPAEPGAAIYFTRAGKPYVIACDNYDRLCANVRALGATVEALRAIERHGSTDMMEQAFTGFAALPAPRVTEPPWYEVLGLPASAARSDVDAAHQRLALEHHPDRGGDAETMARVNRARDVAYERLDGAA